MEKTLFKEEKLNLYPIKKSYELFSKSLIFKDQLEKRIKNNSNENQKILTAVGKPAVIDNFKLLFDQSIKIMRKYIEYEDGRDACDTYKCFFRTAGEKGLIDDFHKWIKFYKAIDSISEAPYTDETVNEVCLIAKEFDVYVKKLISFLEEEFQGI